MKVIYTGKRTIYDNGGSWVIAIPRFLMETIVKKYEGKKSFPVEVEVLNNGDVIVKTSKLINENKEVDEDESKENIVI